MVGKRIVIVLILMFSLFAMLSGCAPGHERFVEEKPAGFFWGIWHGWIAPISLIGGIFNHAIRVYEVDNTGWWYDFGFYMAVISGFGMLSLRRRKRW